MALSDDYTRGWVLRQMADLCSVSLGIAEKEGYYKIAKMINSYEEDWQKANSEGEVNAFEEYLEQYPNAMHSAEAKLKLALLESMSDPEANAGSVVAETETRELFQEGLATDMNQVPKLEKPDESVSSNTASNAQAVSLEENKTEDSEKQISTHVATSSPSIDFACAFYSREQCDEYIVDDKSQVDDMKTLCFQSFGNVEASCRGGAPSCSYRTSWGLNISYNYSSDSFYFKQSCIEGGGELR